MDMNICCLVMGFKGSFKKREKYPQILKKKVTMLDAKFDFVCNDKQAFRLLFVIIICVGILGNLTNVLVFSRKNLRCSFTFRLIFYLSLIDLLILVLYAFESTLESQFEINIRVEWRVFCKIDTFLAHFLLHTRNILSLAILINSKYNS